MNNKNSVERKFFSVREVATILGLSRTCVYEYALRGIIPSTKVGNRILIPKEYVERVLSEVAK